MARTVLGAATTAIMLVAILAPTSEANPNVPYCEGSVAGTDDQRVIMPEVCEQTTGRVFPEALEAKDFVSFYEFEAGIEYLFEGYEDKLDIIIVAESAGLLDASGTLRSMPVYIIEVTNKQSPVPMEERQQLFFMLSIHGNEKGGREGGFRVIEDFAKNIASAAETVQNGAGMPTPMPKPTGGNVETYHDYLDFMRLIFIFPNPDGWVHDEAEFASEPCPGYVPTLFCRTNGNGFDLNRQAPTLGYQYVSADDNRLPVSQPEMEGSYAYMVEHYDRVDYAIDIHGMLNHENFVAIMMPAGSFTPQEMLRSTRLAEDLKARLNNDDHFSAWTDVLGASMEALQGPVDDVAETFEDEAGPTFYEYCGLVDFCFNPLTFGGASVASTEFADWSTVWDAIGYTDSGFHGDFFAQDTGLNAPGYDIELAYNHITFDSQYEGVGAQMNDYHVHSVRHIVHTFMDAAALDVQVSIETNGQRTAYLRPTTVVTNLDDASPSPGGWADDNDGDDHWQYTADEPFSASPATYWEELAPFLRDGEAPGVLVPLDGQDIDGERLASFDNLVIPGSAIEEVLGDEAAIAAIYAWVEAGGNLALTDQALQYMDAAGIFDDAVANHFQYAGAIELDREHELSANVRGEARQSYEPVPVGFKVGLHSPNWYVDAAAFEAAGGDVAGRTVDACQQGECDNPDGVSLGRLNVGDGRIQFIGALLPDPSEEFYHPYGLDGYATTYSGNQILRNMLGWEEVFRAPPVVLSDAGRLIESENEPNQTQAESTAQGGATEDAPGLGVLLLLATLAIAVVARRR